jgi:hypothetical protein
MEPTAYERLAQTIRSAGPAVAIERLIAQLREEKDYARLFDALLLQARFELELSVVPTQEGPPMGEPARAAYEDRVVGACRIVGQLFLDTGQIPRAFQYFHLIGELGPIYDAIERFEPADDDESTQAVIEIAVAQGVHPRKGLAMILRRYGTCQAITACEQILYTQPRSQATFECIQLLVRELYHELTDRVGAEIAARESSPPTTDGLATLVKNRDWLFENENYHVDTSHLNAVVRMARLLPNSQEVKLAMELCEYGRRLSERYRYPDPPPFENVYHDSLVYFKVLAGLDVTSGLEHFRHKADAANLEEVGSMPAEVYVNLLVQLGRYEEALSYAGAKLNRDGFAPRSCPSVNDLCQAARRYDELARLARLRDDVVSFTAGLVAQAQSGSGD